MDSSHPNESHADAVDFDLIEPSKENVQPLRQGRNPHALVKSLAAAPSSCLVKDGLAPGRTEASIKSERKALEAAIKAYPADGAAPLAPWLDYIRWTQQSFLSASARSHLVPLLEKCTRTFLRDERVNASLKYLHVWCMYADALPDCLVVFEFLEANKVLLMHAALWEGWSQTLERRERRAEAEAVLERGLSYGAEPKANLKRALSGLQARIAKHIANQIASSSSDSSATPSDRLHADSAALAAAHGTQLRQPLGRIGAAREAVVARPSNGQTVRTGGAGFAPRGESQSFASASARPAMPAATGSSLGNFQVFCDTDSSSTASLPAPVENHWTTLASASSAGKENNAVAGKWTKPLDAPRVDSNRAVREGDIVVLPDPTPSFPVFVDAECEAENIAARAAAATQAMRDSAASNPRKRFDAQLLQASAAEQGTIAKLQANPLRNMKPAAAAASSSSASASASSSSASAAAKAPIASSRK